MGLLQPKQQLVFDEYLASPTIKEICLYGSSRSGKTFLASDYALERAIAYPGSFHLYIRATLTALTSGVVSQTFPDLFRAIAKQPGGVNISETKTDTGLDFIYHRANPYNRFTLYNGSEIRFMGLDTETTNKSALDKILSQEYLTIIIEEGPEVDFEVVEMVKTRMAQKVNHWITGKPGIPKLIVTLNPRLYDDWDYVYFQKKMHPIDDIPLSNPEEIAAVHFDLADNLENVSDDYLKRLQSLSSSKQTRFLVGEHSDNFEGEIFKKISWEPLPAISEFRRIIIYTDPSFKSGPKNDYKASVVIGERNGAYWIMNGRAAQCTTAQMVLHVSDLYQWVLGIGWKGSVPIWFENAGMPDDFVPAIQSHADVTGWVCPYQSDNRQKGDKFARIEALLEPLNVQGKLFFNRDIKADRFGTLATVQFLNFKHHLLRTEHDDIPDAVHGAVSLMNQPVIKPGGTSMVDKNKGVTF